MINRGRRSRSGRICCLVAGTLTPLQLTGCTSWMAVDSSPEAKARVVEEEGPHSVRIIRNDGDRMVVWYPRIEADTLSGYLYADSLREGTVRMTLSEIDQLELRRPDRGKTTTLVLGAIGVVALSVLIAVSYETIGFEDDGGL